MKDWGAVGVPLRGASSHAFQCKSNGTVIHMLRGLHSLSL
jgi:hypothetical protein